MKKYLILLFVTVLFTLSGCRPSVSVNSPMLQTTPDYISKPTKTLISKETMGELPKNTWVKTDPEEKLEVRLEENTVVTINRSDIELPKIPETPVINSEETITKDKLEPPKATTLEAPIHIVLPKNTPVVLPENTYLQTSDQAKVLMEAQTEVTLPVGTEISITKINWYAILFYSLVVILIAWYYLQSKGEDKDGDGFVDDKKSDSEIKP